MTAVTAGVLGGPCQCGSGKSLRDCHGVTTPPTPPAPVNPDEVLARPPVVRKLDLASGQSPREGFEGVDIWRGARHVVDLQEYPWPFADASVLELHCSHYIEHIPMEYMPGWGNKDALFAFFDECWRILIPDGWLHIVVPAHRSDRAFQDPTHRRFITAQTFAYMSEQWRRDTKLDHYNVDCNFIGECHPVIDAGLQMRYPETAQIKIQKEWNTVIDWTARLQKKPRLPPKPGA
jgi:predicted SAM-dependent methyltransferase